MSSAPRSASRAAYCLQGGHQAELVQGGRPQVVDEPADVGEGGLHLGLEFGERRGRGSGSVRQGVAGRVEAERDAGQRRAEPVVQVTADPAPLLLARGDECFAGALQVTGERRGVSGDRDVPGQVVKQREVALAVGLCRGPLRDDQRPGLRTAQHQRHDDLGVGLAGRRRRPARHRRAGRPRRRVRVARR